MYDIRIHQGLDQLADHRKSENTNQEVLQGKETAQRCVVRRNNLGNEAAGKTQTR